MVNDAELVERYRGVVDEAYGRVYARVRVRLGDPGAHGHRGESEAAPAGRLPNPPGRPARYPLSAGR